MLIGPGKGNNRSIIGPDTDRRTDFIHNYSPNSPFKHCVGRRYMHSLSYQGRAVFTSLNFFIKNIPLDVFTVVKKAFVSEPICSLYSFVLKSN